MNEYPQIELSEWTKVDAMPDTQNCLHGDFQPGNITCGYQLENHHHALADAEACAWIAREIL